VGRWHGRAWFAAAAAVALATVPALAGPRGSAPAAAAADPPGVVRAAADLRLVSVRGRALGGPWQRWARASLMPTVGGRLTIVLTGCRALPRAAGCVYRKRPRTIYLRRGIRRPRSVLLHEMGHLFDLRVMNNRDRGRFRRIMRARRRAWWKGRTPLAEQFAEAYSFCARYRRIVSIARYSSYHYRPSRSQHNAVCRLIVAVARDRAPSAPAPQAPLVTRPDPEPPPQPSPSAVPGSGGRPQPRPSPTPTPTPSPNPAPPLPPVPTVPPLPATI
jgi:hypothetical protein